MLDLAKLGPDGLDLGQPDHVSTVIATLMSAGDLGAMTRPWAVQQQVGGAVFFLTMMSLKRQHSKKGNFVSFNAGLLERDFGYS